MLERELTDFGERIGIPTLAWGEGEALTLAFGDFGTLTLACPQSEDDDFLLSFSRPARPEEARKAFWSALASARWSVRHPYALVTGVHRDRWILGLKLPVSRVSGAELESALRYLLQLESSLFGGH